MAGLSMCTGKVRFATAEAALAEASLQAAQRPHFLWHWYDCLWCDFLHIGRAGAASGHSRVCEARCAHLTRQARELRILEGTW